MTRRDDVIDAIWDVLDRHAPDGIELSSTGDFYVLCRCQPIDAARMRMPIWHRHIAELAADAASKLNDDR